MKLRIDDDFVRQWHPRYDDTECDEPQYQSILRAVASDLSASGTISRETFLDIWKWKKAIRKIGAVRMDQYEAIYRQAFRLAASDPPERKLARLLTPGIKLPGVEAPSGSTLLHFMHPQLMPIIDVRTVEVLFEAGLISGKQRNLAHYEEFRHAIDEIRRRCPGWTLRQIDRALFAYHKQILEKQRTHKSYSPMATQPERRNHSVRRSSGHAGTGNHNRFATVFQSRQGQSFSTSEIQEIMLSESNIEKGSILPNDHGEGNAEQCWCVGTEQQIFDRLGRGSYRVRQHSN